MTNINELIEMANKLCNTLDKASNDEKKFSDDILIIFEKMSWEMYRTTNDLIEIQSYLQ